MAWAKLHTDILGDPKLMRAARHGMAGLLLLPWLIVAAKHADDDGRLTVGGHAMEADDLVPMIPGATPAEVRIALANLTELGVLVAENGVLRFAAWHPRQSKPSDSNEAWRERQQRSRARRKTEAKHDTSEPVTPPLSENVTPRHASVMPRGHAIEVEAEVEEEERREEMPRAGAREAAAATGLSPALTAALQPFLASACYPASITGEVRAALDGMRGTVWPEATVIQALTDMQAANVSPFSPRAFRAFLQGVADESTRSRERKADANAAASRAEGQRHKASPPPRLTGLPPDQVPNVGALLAAEGLVKPGTPMDAPGEPGPEQKREGFRRAAADRARGAA